MAPPRVARCAARSGRSPGLPRPASWPSRQILAGRPIAAAAALRRGPGDRDHPRGPGQRHWRPPPRRAGSRRASAAAPIEAHCDDALSVGGIAHEIGLGYEVGRGVYGEVKLIRLERAYRALCEDCVSAAKASALAG